MGNKLNELQAAINALLSMAELESLIDQIIIIAGGLGGVIIPPKPNPVTHGNAQTWHDEMYANWQAAGAPEN